jgi:alginate O-acetyltransferase complex protein AlgI
MNFVSLDFFYFLVIVIAGFYSLPDRWRNAFLLAASYFFYAYWSVKYLCLLVFTMVLDYWIALKIDSSKTESKRKNYLVFSLVLNLGILFIFKYFNLFSSAWAELFSHKQLSLSLILPFGISFYTFHAMSYTIDVYRRIIPAERNFTYYSGYVMFFPQLVAGPIARASHLLHQFAEPKRLRRNNLIEAAWRISKGYFMKAVIADNLAPVVDACYGTDVARTPLMVVQAVYLFSFQIYFDFAGYSEIARGVARIFDYDLVVNFRKPYLATNITDFWRRWHISLSTWLRDYLYISLGGNRKGLLKTYRNLMITMLLGGLWHGGNWTFLVWGGLHGALLSFEKYFEKFNKLIQAIPTFLKQIITFHLVTILWIFFRSNTFSQAYEMLRFFVTFFLHPWKYHHAVIQFGMWELILAWIFFEWLGEKVDFYGFFYRANWKVRFAFVYLVLVITVLFAQLDPKAFIYFQF